MIDSFYCSNICGQMAAINHSRFCSNRPIFRGIGFVTENVESGRRVKEEVEAESQQAAESMNKQNRTGAGASGHVLTLHNHTVSLDWRADGEKGE